MEEVKQDVNATDPSAVDKTVNTPVEETTTEQTVTQEQDTPEQTQPTPEVVKPQGDVDEMGVPYKNRFYEMKRKYDDVQGNLPNMIQEAVQRAIPTQQAPQPQYTEEQLIQFKNETEDNRAKAWAEMELRKIDDRKSEQKFKSIIDEREQRIRVEQEQSMAFQAVRNKYSVAFNPDGSPNGNHPLTQKTIQIYNSDPNLQRDGRGLLKAADMAFADYALQQSPQLAQQTKQLKRQVKKLEKATLVEGSGQPQSAGTKNPLNVAKEKLYKTGKTEDLAAVTKELMRARGMI
jgi:hypothetical protein